MKNKLYSFLAMAIIFMIVTSEVQGQQAIPFYDYYPVGATKGTSTTPITDLHVYVDEVDTTSTNIPGNTITQKGWVEHTLEFEMNVPTTSSWTIQRDVICNDNIKWSFEGPCIAGQCYVVPGTGGFGLSPSWVSPVDFTASPAKPRYALKVRFSTIRLWNKSAVSLKYTVGTGTRTNGVFTFDNNFKGEVNVHIHVDSASCAGTPNAVKDINQQKLKVQVSPNPVIGNHLKVNIEGSFGSNTYKLLDLTGKVIQTGSSKKDTFTIDLENATSKGIYLLHLENKKSGHSTIEKIVID